MVRTEREEPVGNDVLQRTEAEAKVVAEQVYASIDC